MFRVFVFSLIISCFATIAAAEKRIALVVGNGDYETIDSLKNPVADGQLIAETLTDLGFEVMLVNNGDLQTLRRTVAEFGKALRAAGRDATGLFYYAGHGVQSFGTNYILPVDASLTDAADLDLVALEAASILRQMASAKNKTNIFILDACRDNPFEAIPEFSDNGLAEMSAPTGTYMAFATAPGAVAWDGRADNSAFSASLAKALKVENSPIEQVFKTVRVEVLEKTRGAQTPWSTSSLTDEFIFAKGPERDLTTDPVEQAWESVRRSRDALQITLYMRSYPNSPFIKDARALLAEVIAEELAPDQVASTRAATPPPASEIDMIETARKSGSLQDYEAYLTAYPNGTYSELAQYEIAILREKAAANGETVPAPTNLAVAPPAEAGPVTLATPIGSGPEQIVGLTIQEVILSRPLFPPIPDLPEEFWAEKVCSDCHQWNPERLCTQAQVYLGTNQERSLNKQHPFGGAFKKHLNLWASNDCR